MKNGKFPVRLLWIAVFLTLAAVPAQADFAVPLVFIPTAIHMIFVNILLGLGEGLIIALFFHSGKLRSIGIMILANYATSLAGFCLAPWLRESVNRDGIIHLLTHLRQIHWKVIVLLFCATVLLEWPFCIWILGRHNKRAIVALGSSLVAQLASYAVLVPLYFAFYESPQFMESFTFDPSLATGIHEAGTIYFLSREEKALCSMDLNGQQRKKIMNLPYSLAKPKGLGISYDFNHDLELSLRRNPLKKWDLVLMSKAKMTEGLLLGNIPGKAAEITNTHPVPDLRSSNPVAVIKMSQMIPGMFGFLSEAQTDWCYLNIDTPLVRGYAQYPTMLQGDRIVAEFLGNIILVDITQRKICPLARGYCPAVILRK